MEPITEPTAFDLIAQRMARSLLTWGLLIGLYCSLALLSGLPLPAWAPAAGMP